jgi:Rrf2 family protein
MLRLSKKIDYGLILLRDLCQGQTALSAREIAARYQLPASMAANILKALASARILESQRGAQGGYLLARHPSRVSLAEIVEALDGPFFLVDCVSDDACCQFSPVCPTHDPMQMVHRKFKDFMARLSLEEIVGMGPRPIAFKVSPDENAYLPG